MRRSLSAAFAAVVARYTLPPAGTRPGPKAQ